MSRDTPSAPHFYAGQYLDRASDRRKDAAWLAQMLADPQTRYVPVWQHKSLISSGPFIQLPNNPFIRLIWNILMGEHRAKYRQKIACELQRKLVVRIGVRTHGNSF